MVKTRSNQIDTLARKKHISCLISSLTGELSKHYEKLVPSQTWIVYWITHSLSLLEQTQFLDSVVDDVIEFMRECAHKSGGYGGGPGQIAHLATTFAAVNALITTSSEEALESIDRVNLVRFLHRMKQPDGSFSVHDDGEIDSRATYCVLSIMKCLNIQDKVLLENVTDWILSCQTYEGGFGSVPGSEAHGGYTFCCVASLCLMDHLSRANIPALIRWLVSKQIPEEGGFCGRSNKLVDSCYSYWQGAVFPLIHPSLVRAKSSSPTNNLDSWLFDSDALQDYILNQCQSETGLLRDKPGAQPDFYHTCYALSGLSISQHQPSGATNDIGSLPINVLGRTHPLFNLSIDSLDCCLNYFENKKIETIQCKSPCSQPS